VTGKARVLLWSIVLAALATASLCASASANHSLKDEISIGPAGGNGSQNAFFDATSQDGARAIFETSEALVSADTDGGCLASGGGCFDIYERVGTTTTLLSGGANGAFDAFFDDASDDATHVFFDTNESLVAADTDTAIDIYERFGGTTTLVSTNSAGANTSGDATFDGISRDGAHVFFETDDSLASGDTDSVTDIYDHSGGTTRLVTTGPTAGGGGSAPIFGGASSNGSHVFFETDESLVSGDTDGQYDVYDRSSGTTTTLVSTGPAGGNGAAPASYSGNSRDGSRVFFSTDESLVSGDTDVQFDVYQRASGTTTLVSTGASGGNGATGAFFDGSSADGTHVFFHTTESLVVGDTDTFRDVYDRSAGATALVSTGPNGGNGSVDAFFDGSSLDGLVVWFDTTESLVADDTDSRADVYRRSSGTTSRVSTGSNGGNGAADAFFTGASDSGDRVFFTTAETLEPTDTDARTDVYERFSGATTEISTGATGGNGDIPAFFDAASADGERVFFNTRESLLSSDTDTARDVYVASINGFPRPKGATPFRASFAIAYQACSSPNRTHGAPLSAGSCSPPVQSSSQLTVGTLDSNGKPANSVGFVRYDVIVGDGVTPADVNLATRITDVRKKSDLSDYTGQLQLTTTARITDKNNGSGAGGGTDSATVTDSAFPATVPCTGTSDTTIGSTCSLSTTFNAVSPGSVVAEKRANWQLGTINLFDGGTDGLVSTGPNTLFATEGVFIP
jgi:hypothetical protein